MKQKIKINLILAAALLMHPETPARVQNANSGSQTGGKKNKTKKTVNSF